LADIFISYAREDRALAARIAGAIEAQGMSVWWDRRLDAGAEFSKDIERELKAAKAVVVAWSAAGAASPWVRDEAAFARNAGKLVSIRLDAQDPPLGFQQFHAADFSKWRGDRQADEFQSLLSSLSKRVGEASAAGSPAAAQMAPAQRTAKHKVPVPALAVAGAAALALVAGVVLMSRQPAGEEAAATTTSAKSDAASELNAAAAKSVGLAVLPFDNLSSDPEQEHFVDGLTEELLNWLGNVEGLKVPGRTTSFQYKEKAQDMREIGAALGVDYVLEGSVRRSGEALRITAQLIDAKSGYHLWSETYDRQLADIFAIQDEIARLVVTELLGKIPGSGIANPAAVGDVDPEAHELYLEGRALWSERQGPLAIEKFREAIAIDPGHALAQAYFAVLAAHSAVDWPLSGVGGPMIDAALAKAVKLKPQSAEVLFAQGWVAEFTSGAERGAPPNATAVAFYERAVRANPRHVEALHALARADAPSDSRGHIERLKRILEIEPGLFSARDNLIGALIRSGDRGAALQVARAGLAVSPSRMRARLAFPAIVIGDIDLAGEALLSDFAKTSEDNRSRSTIAALLANLGAVEEARFLYANGKRPGNRPWPQLERIQVANLDGDAGAELKAAEDLAAVNPPTYAAWSLAMALINTGAPERAYQGLLERYPDYAGPAEVNFDYVSWGEESAGPLLTAAHALERAGRRGEARALWKAALADAQAEPADIWTRRLTVALAHAWLGDEPASVREFKAAYDKGFRYLWSYYCTPCAHNGFFAEHGLFAPMLAISENRALFEKIKAENAATLADFNRKYGILDKVRAEMKAQAAQGRD